MAAIAQRFHIGATLQLLILAILPSFQHCILCTITSGTDWDASRLLVRQAASSSSCSESKTLHCAFLLKGLVPHLKPLNLKTFRPTARHAATSGAAAPAAVTTIATQSPAFEAKPLSLLERVQLHQDAEAAEQLLRQWEEQRDALLLTSWNSWAAAVGVSVEQLQQVVLLVYAASATTTTKKQRRNQRKHAVFGDVASAGGGGGHVPSKLISCAGGVLSASAYELLLSLLHPEAALLLKGPQSSKLLGLRRPPSVQEWAAVAAVDTTAADAALLAARAVRHAADFSRTASSSTRELGTSHLAANVDMEGDLKATEKQQRAALFEQLSALHAFMSWQQQQLATTASAAVRKFRGIGASLQERRAAAAEGGDADSAAAAGNSNQDGLLLMALQHAREGLKKYALDTLEKLHLNSSVAARPTEKDSLTTTNSEASISSSDSKGSAAAAPLWITYWGWLQQGMSRWSRMQRVPYEIPAGWWAAAAALRRLRHQQETDELQCQEDQLDFFGPLIEEEKTQQICSSLSISPQRLRAVQLATKKPMSTEVKLMGHKPDKGERRDRVGELLEADESAWEQEEQQQRMRTAAEEIWQFAAANLEPEQLQALQEAAENPLATELQKREPLLQSAVRRLREAELKRLMQQLPAERRAAAASDPAMQRQLLAEQAYIVRLLHDACSQ
ncbi:hypothetical protein Emag_005253 [Eimeria magna]